MALVHSADDRRVYAAAAGLRPEFDDSHELDEQQYVFAPSNPSYRVMRDGSGTVVTLYGTDWQGRSMSLHATGFRPYLYVSLERIDAHTTDSDSRDELVQRLIAELDAQLLLINALDTCTWSPERLSLRRAVAGQVRHRKLYDAERQKLANSKQWAHLVTEDAEAELTRVWISEADQCCRPIVGWEVTEGLPARGCGPGSGYRGMRAQRFLKLYMYSPNMVTKARDLLHGKSAELGPDRQAVQLAKRRRRSDIEEKDADDDKAARKGRPLSRMEKAALDPKQKKLTMRLSDPKELDNDDGAAAVINARDQLDELEDEDDDDEDYGLLQRPQVEDDETEDSEDDNYDVGGETWTVVRSCEVGDQKMRFETRLDKRFIRRVQRERSTVEWQMLADGQSYDVFEADIDFVLRFAIDCGFAWEQWVSVDFERELLSAADGSPTDTPLRVSRLVGNQRRTRTQVELRADYRHMKLVDDEAVQNKPPKHLLMSLDCEMEPGPNNEFPDANSNRMLQCVVVVRGDNVVGEKKKFWFRSVSFVLLSVDCRTEPRPYCSERHIIECATEQVLFEALGRFIRLAEAQLVTGYNSDGFDLPYMLDRAHVLGVGDEFQRAWGRSLYSSRLRVKERTFSSSQAGNIRFTDVMAEGSTFIDLFKKLQRDPLIKLRAYTLNAVASHFLGDQKEDMSYSLIRQYQQTALGREKLRSYCEKDALLPLELFEHLLIMPGMIEMARINSCSMQVLLNRGQQVRSKCCLYRAGARESPPIRFYTRTEEERRLQASETFQGATVVNPKPGLYEEPVATLDWSSLYPSIMVTHNLCMTTRVAPDYDLTLDPDIMGCQDPLNELTVEERQARAAAAVWRVPDMTSEMPYVERASDESLVFLRHPVRLGIVPKVQIDYLKFRKRTKGDMKQAYVDGDIALAQLLDKRQLAIKMLANSLYGMLGATCSFGYTPTVSSTVTLRGRCLLYLMRSLAINEFDEHDVDVVYGDTDSIFVHMRNVKDLHEAAAIGVQMSEFITAEMKRRYTTDSPEHNILNLEFEKVFRKILLLAKKRYAGLKYEYDIKTNKLTPKPADGVPTTSGLETKRRDTTLLVSRSMDDVLGLMLDYRYPLDTNLTRMRAYVWEHMVRPLLNNTINMRLLIVTKQLRMLPWQYAADGRALPIHVQLAQKLIERAGGEHAQNAPRAGARLPYVVVEGSKYSKVSERGEDPVYALDNNLRIDSRYYLDRHVRPTLLRLLVPVLTNQKQKQKVIGDPSKASTGARRQFGMSETTRKRHNDAQAAEFLFGHIKDYHDPLSRAEQRQLAGVRPMYKEHLPPVHKRPRYTDKPTFQSAAKAGATGKQNTLLGSVVHGARCQRCKKFVAGAARGFMCSACVQLADGSGNNLAKMRTSMLDIEELYDERRMLADTCHDCMGCRDAPRKITCQNTDCQILWDRKQNLASINALEKRIDTISEVLVSTRQLARLHITDEADTKRARPTSKSLQ